MTDKLKKAAKAIIDFLSRPFTRMWAFTVSLLVVYLSLKYSLDGRGIQLKYVVPELFTLSLLLSLLKGKWRTGLEWFFIVFLGILSAVEVFLMNHFKLELSCQAVQLLLETNSREASEFCSSFVFTTEALKYFGVLSLGLAISGALYWVRAKGFLEPFVCKIKQWPRCVVAAEMGIILFVAAFYFMRTGWMAMQPRFAYSLLSSSVNEFEERFIAGEEAGGCGVCTPLSRFIHGSRLYLLTTKQCDELIEVSKTAKIDCCDHTSSNIMLMIGESFIKRHAQIYGYDKPTTPRMLEEMNKGNLVAIEDAITMVARTSDVFKEMLSMHSIDQAGSWASEPMFPQLFKQAGYRVSMISNQYARFKHDIWNSTGAFFLVNPDVSKILLDYHNEYNYRFDESLLKEVDTQMSKKAEHNLVMLHMRGQHVSFEYGYPENQRYFTTKDYANRKGLKQEQKQDIADYDNCTRYQDSITGALFDRFANKDMVIVFVSDHGENVYDDGKTLGRVHNDFSRAMLESEYQVPMWIWYSDKYKALHPEMVEKIKSAAKRPFETDDIPHLMLELAGIRCKYFDAKRSLINAKFNTRRVRLVGDQKLNYEQLLKK